MQYIEGQKWLLWKRPLGARYRQYLQSVGRPLKPRSVTICLVAIVLTKPVIAILVPKLVAMPTTLRHWISAMSSSDSLTQRTHPYNQRICRWLEYSQSYNPSKAKKPVIGNCVPKLGSHVTRFLWPIPAHNPKGISIGSAVSHR